MATNQLSDLVVRTAKAEASPKVRGWATVLAESWSMAPTSNSIIR